MTRRFRGTGPTLPSSSFDDGAIPHAHALPPVARATVAATAMGDVALRTALSTVLTATMAPLALGRDVLARESEHLRFYAELADARDPATVFLPPRPARSQVVHSVGLPTSWLPGILQVVRRGSTYEACNPAIRERYRSHERNGWAWAQHWRHREGPRPTLLVVHGFGASVARFNRLFFALPWFYSKGYDILLATLPFHGRRRTRPYTYSGAGLVSGGMSQLHESLLHGVHDLRGWIDHLEGQGAPSVGVTGLSLGGYTSALLAAADDRPHVVIPNAPVTDLTELMESWFPAGPLARRLLERHGVDGQLLVRSLALHSPLSYPSQVPRERLFVIAGLGDRLAPPSQARALWEHWDRPAVHWFPGNHVVHVQRGAYLRRTRDFLEASGFAGT